MNQIAVPLAVSQTIIWASIYYLFPALILVWEGDLGWSRTALSGAYSMALLASAICATRMGRLIDEGHGRRVMITGTVSGIICLVALSQVSAIWQFYVVWIALGVSMSASLYEPCFALITHHMGRDAKRVILRITLIAGFAGTVSFPSANFLADQIGWRMAVIVFAVVVAITSLPLTLMATRNLVQLHPRPMDRAAPDQTLTGQQRRTLLLFSLAFITLAFNHNMVISHLLPLLAERSVSQALAVLVASLIGPMQVLGRLLMLASERRVSTYSATITCFVGLTVGAAALAMAGASIPMIFAFTFLHGASWGTMSNLRPAMTRDITDGAGFGAISGKIFAISLLGSALAPFAGALFWKMGGYDLMLGVAVMLAVLGTLLLLTMNAPEASRRI